MMQSWKTHQMSQLNSRPHFKAASELFPELLNWVSVTFTPKVMIKGMFSDFHTTFLWHESEDINQKRLFPKFQLIPILRFQVMHDYVCLIAPIDYCVE